MKLLLQIVPGLSPPPSGVGDYAVRLAGQLRSAHGLQTEFLVCQPGWSVPLPAPEFPVQVLQSRDPAAFVNAIEAVNARRERLGPNPSVLPVLLQLSAYGYERNGCPAWLLKGLQQWKNRHPEASLTTMFHELHAGGPPWTKAFWMSPWQRRVLGGIAALSDHSMTNMRQFARQLSEWTGQPQSRIACLATPSSVGEPESVKPIANRSRRACIFGIRPGSRRMADGARVRLATLLAAWEISEICVLGESPETATFDGLGCRVSVMGYLAVDALSAILLDSRLGLLSYPALALGKSSVFAAYCAHALPTLLLPVVGDSGSSSEDGLQEGMHYARLVAADPAWSDEFFQGLATQARMWYLPHRVAAHGELVAQFMNARSARP